MSASTSKRKDVFNKENSKVDVPEAKKAKTGHWSQGLLSSMNDPNYVVKKTDSIVIIRDKYPKAMFHFLVLPKENIPNLKSLTKEHLPLLQYMHEQAEEIISGREAPLGFKIGYHAVPSMSQLHMHVISQDFNSPCLKTKTHWNSFTTEYFIPSEEVLNDLKQYGRIRRDDCSAKDLLKTDLRCHICHTPQKTMPKLKEHILYHVNKK